MFTAEKQEQLKRHADWQAEHLHPGAAEPKSGGEAPPRFSGDWSGAKFGDGADLRCADFRDVDTMAGARLKGADLRGARLDGVDLRAACFDKARTDGAVFREADLRDAQLADPGGVSVEHLAGADLRSAGLPGDVKEFAQLGGVAEVSKYLQSIYRLLLLLCGFAALTSMSVRDENLVLRDGQSLTPLPLLQADVSPQVFAFMMPGLILLLYGYQVLYTVTLWRLLSFLPAYFPDGEPLDRRAYPSMENIFVRYSLRRIVNERNDELTRLIHWVVTFTVPVVTLMVIWLSGLKRHDGVLSLYQAMALSLATYLALAMLTLSGGMIRNEWRIKDVSMTRFLRLMPGCVILFCFVGLVTAVWVSFPAVPEHVPDVVPLGLVALVVVVGAVDLRAWVRRRRAYAEATSSLLLNCMAFGLALDCVSLSSFDGPNFDLKPIDYTAANVLRRRASNVPDGKRLQFPEQSPKWQSPLLAMLSGTRFTPFLDFRNKVISKRPDGWKGSTENDQIALVVGADLEGADLRSIEAERAFLARANLRRADLRSGYLRFAYLREADLSGARLGGAYIRGANLRDANLHGVDFDGVILSEDLDDPTTKIGPNFQGARIDHKDPVLTSRIVETLAREEVANLPLVYFGVQDAAEWDVPSNHVLHALKGLGMPRLTDKMLIAQVFDAPLTFPPSLPMTGRPTSRASPCRADCVFDGVDLRGASFAGADLAGASFVGAKLGGADFTKANIDKAKFQGATLAGATFIGSTWQKASGFSDEQKDLFGAAEGHPLKAK